MKNRLRNPWVMGAVILLLLGAVLYFPIRRAAHQAKVRAEVYSWIRSMERWDKSLTESENSRRRIEGLRSLGKKGVDLLVADLSTRTSPLLLKLAEKIPYFQRFLPSSPGPDTPEEVRHRAVYHLGELGPDARSAAIPLLELVNDPDSRVRCEVAFTLGRIGDRSPAVRAALTNLLTDPDRDTRFSATIALWQLHPENPDLIQNVEKLISTNNLGWPGLCLRKIGPKGLTFAPVLASHIAEVPWSRTRVYAVDALWRITNDKSLVVAQLESLALLLNQPGATPSRSGWTPAEESLGAVVIMLDEEAEFRNQMRPMLKSVLANPSSQAHRMARVYLEKFDGLDRRKNEASSDSEAR